MADPTRRQIILVGQRLIRKNRNQITAAKKKGHSLKQVEAQLAMWESIAAKGYAFAKLSKIEQEFVIEAVEEDEAEGWDD